MLEELTIEEIRQAYDDFILPYFAEDEVKPLDMIWKVYEKGYYKVLALKKEDEIAACAFLALYPGGRACLLDYLAVRKDLRNDGYGSRMLRELSAIYGKTLPIMIETETVEEAVDEDDRQLRIRRNQFYERNGVKPVDLKTLIFGVPFNIWVLGDADGIDVTGEMERVYRFMVPEPLFARHCFIPEPAETGCGRHS